MTTAFVPVTPLAVKVVVAVVQIGLAAAVAEEMPASTLLATVTEASAGDPQSAVTLA